MERLLPAAINMGTRGACRPSSARHRYLQTEKDVERDAEEGTEDKAEGQEEQQGKNQGVSEQTSTTNREGPQI
jgi:hypothetical protein